MTIGEARRMAGFPPDERLRADLASNYTRPRPNWDEENFSGLKQYPPTFFNALTKWGNVIHPIPVRIEINTKEEYAYYKRFGLRREYKRFGLRRKCVARVGRLPQPVGKG